MANLRVTRLSVKSSTKIEVDFTAELDTSIGLGNISIKAAAATTDDLTIKSVSVSGATMTLSLQPMVPRALYELVLISTTSQAFRGKKGESLVEDGATNHVFFTGQAEDNEVLDTILGSLPGIYNAEDSFARDSISPGADEILRAARAANEVRNASFISVTVEDEEFTRGSGPFDRFANEGVFKLIRVGSGPAGVTAQGSLSFSEFPSDPISLQQVSVSDEEVSNTSNSANSFEGLIVTLAKGPIIKLTSLTLERGTSTFTYDIEQFRYGLKESKFDSANAYPALDITDNQVRLSTAAVGPSFPLPQGNDTIKASYLYKKAGRTVSAESVVITSVEDATRESVPAVALTFFLDHAPIVDANGKTPTRGGVTWLDPSQNFDPTAKHPAFLSEIPFSESAIPTAPGEFAVDYATGRVFVAGVDGSGTDGTTVVPPVATYKFKRTFQDGLDYNFLSDLNEVAAVAGRSLEGAEATIAFGFEDAFADGTDFAFASHVEKLDERIENRLIGTSGLKTKNGPVTDVFRIFNETTGEIYTTTRIIDNQVFFSSNTPPVLKTVTREAATFDDQIQDQIVVTDELTIAGKTFVAFKVELSEINIIAATGDFIGASFNSSLVFSDASTFQRELYFDPDDTEAANLARLQKTGDYMVDYALGIAYVAVLSGADTDIGDATYRYGDVRTRNRHIVSVEDLYRSASSTVANAKTFTVSTVNDETVPIKGLNHAGESTASGAAILVSSSGTVTVSQDALRVRHVFHVTDLRLSANPVDFAEGAVISSSSQDTITLAALGATVEDLGFAGAGLTVQQTGARKFVEVSRLANIKSGPTKLAELVDDATDSTFLGRTYAVSDLLTGVNYFALGSDGYVDKPNDRIVLPSATPASAVGKKVRAKYRAKLLANAAVIVDYTPGDIFIDYTYLRDEILVSYEYGDNVLDWSISDTLDEGETYFASYRYGALREPLRDNFGLLTSVEELSTIPSSLDRETYRAAVLGSLQSFLKGPTIPAIEQIVEAFTGVTPNITESAFLEWILGKDHLHLLEMKLKGRPGTSDPPGYAPGRFGQGLLLNESGQTAELPATSNMRFAEGTWEAFVTPDWAGVDNDAALTFDLTMDGVRNPAKVFLGASNINPATVPFTIDKTDSTVLGRPTQLHSETGYFLWFDTTANKWRLRTRAPILESREFDGTISTTGQFNDVRVAASVDGYDGYDGYGIDEINDMLISTDSMVEFKFVVDGYDLVNMTFDAYQDGYFAGFDGIDFQSDNVHYLLDTGLEEGRCRMSLLKDGKGFLRYRVHDQNGRVKMLSAVIKDWEVGSTHHVATSWKIGTVEQRDEIHLFVDGQEVPNTYRFRGYLDVPAGLDLKYMDEAPEILLASAAVPTVGGTDLVTTAGSDIVTSLGATFITDGVVAGAQFRILDNTADGLATDTAPFVFVRSVLSENALRLEKGPAGSAVPHIAVSSLRDVEYSVNQQTLLTVSDPAVEKVRVFVVRTDGTETELFSPDTLTPEYSFDKDGYEDLVVVNRGIPIGADVVLRSYGLTQQRCRQFIYVWPDRKTNLLRAIMPQPTSVPKIRVTAITVRRTNIEVGTFAVIATIVGGHLIQLLSSNLDFCQPTNTTTGRRFRVTITGDNFDFTALNEITFVGTTTDGYGSETLLFTETGRKDTTRFFTELTDIIANFTPIDLTKPAGAVEIREKLPITEGENGGEYADVRLSIEEQAGLNGVVTAGQSKLKDGYARFGAEDIGKTIIISSPAAIAGPYTISDVPLDPSGAVKDSDTAILSGTGVPWAASHTGVVWTMLNTSYTESGFANGLITLERHGTGGLPFLLANCWYEVDFPAFAIIPWEETPPTLFTGSDLQGENQAGAVIDELRILDELSDDTGNGEALPSSGRSITTDSQVLREFTPTTQTLALYHFNGCIENKASFQSTFDQGAAQSANSVNALFGQSGVFNRIRGQLSLDNRAIFQNDVGMVEFWASPILDTFNDPTRRYFVDLTPEQVVEAEAASSFIVILPSRARSVSSITVEGSTTNFFTGSVLSSDGRQVTLGQPLPANRRIVTITFVPITSQGDRFSILKDETGALQLFVSASGVEYQISVPVFWKKNTWHRIVAGWDLNNEDNQDRLILMVDGSEGGIVRYGTGLLYGAGHTYGMPTVFGQAVVGTTVARNILADINVRDFFNTVHVGGDFTGQFPAMARVDNMRFSNALRPITRLGGTGPGQLIGQDLLFTSNVNTAQPVIEDALTTKLLDFDTDQSVISNLATVRDGATGIFDFFVEVIDSFSLIPNTDAEDLIAQLIRRLKPAHTRAFVEFGDEEC